MVNIRTNMEDTIRNIHKSIKIEDVIYYVFWDNVWYNVWENTAVPLDMFVRQFLYNIRTTIRDINGIN